MILHDRCGLSIKHILTRKLCSYENVVYTIEITILLHLFCFTEMRTENRYIGTTYYTVVYTSTEIYEIEIHHVSAQRCPARFNCAASHVFRRSSL